MTFLYIFFAFSHIVTKFDIGDMLKYQSKILSQFLQKQMKSINKDTQL